MKTVAMAVGTLVLLAACGAGPATAPTATTPIVANGGVASPSPSPAPSATPTPVAQPTPTPEPSPSPEINDNDRPVDHVGAGVYYIDCNGEVQPGSKNAKDVPAGCRAHLDATPKDEDNVPTNPRYEPQWVYSDPDSMIIQGSNPLGPILTAKRPHDQTIYVRVDGVNSNTVRIKFE